MSEEPKQPQYQSTNPLVNRFLAEKGTVESFLEKVPLLGEAFRKEEYHKADQFVRQETEKFFQQGKKAVQKVTASFAKAGNIQNLQIVEDLEKKLEYLVNKIAALGNGAEASGFKVTREQLDDLVNFDQNIYGKAQLAVEEVQSIQDMIRVADGAPELQEKVDHLLDLLENFETDLSERGKKLMQISE